jgi:hypothetical protein
MAFIYAEGDAHLSGSAQVSFKALESQLSQLLSDFPAVAEELKTAFGGGAARVSPGSLEIVLDADMFGCAAQPEGAGLEPEGLVEGADASARYHLPPSPTPIISRFTSTAASTAGSPFPLPLRSRALGPRRPRAFKFVKFVPVLL